MTDIISKLKSVMHGLNSALNYISEDLEAICDDTMREYAESAIQDAEESLAVLKSLIQQMTEQSTPADDNKYQISYVFGTDAVRAYNHAVDDCIAWNTKKLMELGTVGNYSFATKQELEAFKKGVVETCGWLDAEPIMTNEEWEKHLQENPQDEDE